MREITQKIVFQMPKIVCGWGSTPHSAAGKAYDASEDTLVGWKEVNPSLDFVLMPSATRVRPPEQCSGSATGTGAGK